MIKRQDIEKTRLISSPPARIKGFQASGEGNLLVRLRENRPPAEL